MKNLKAFSMRLVIAASICLASANAAEKIGWDDLLKRVSGRSPCPEEARCEGLIESQRIEVLTQDGQKHTAERVRFAFRDLKLYIDGRETESLPRDTVRRVKYRNTHHFYNPVKELPMFAAAPLLAACWESCDAGKVLFAGILTPPAIALGIVQIPLSPLVYGISLLNRYKTYEVVR